MTPRQKHEKWLRKMGVHPDQLKEKKSKRKVFRPKSIASDYYESKPLQGAAPLRHDDKKLDPALNSVQLQVIEESRTSPRDLGGDKDYSWEK